MNTRASSPFGALAATISWLGGMGLVAALAAPEFTAIQQLPNKEIRLELSAPAGGTYRIEATTNLLNWHSLLTLQSTGVNQHTDAAAPYFRSRFYRALQVSGPNVLTGDHLVTEDGDVVIHPINHATFVMSWNGQMIYVDPVGGAAPFQGLPRANLILVTHGHSDHFNAATLNAVTGATCVIIAPQAVYTSMSATLRSLTIVLTNGASSTALGLPIEAVPAYNLTTSNHLKGVGNGYILTIGGKRIYIGGDTEDVPEMRALQGIDVAFIPMNVPYTMPVDKAASAVRDFRPKVVYPYHYRNGTTPVTYADLNDFKQRVGTDLGIEVRVRNWY